MGTMDVQKKGEAEAEAEAEVAYVLMTEGQLGENCIFVFFYIFVFLYFGMAEWYRGGSLDGDRGAVGREL